ncbi:PAS domain-containing protein [Hymenobacter saemangeumensis]|uniref:PAS domain-containing protein n=1 Tax=Hymenobacter saemangeumensis TaxID=1084522 RepID=UPI0031ECAB8A
MPAADDLLHDLLEVSLTGVILFRPVYAAPGGAIEDLAYEHLNPAAQRMLRLPERPIETFLTLYPGARQEGIFAFYAAAFESGQTERLQVNYQHDGLDGYFHLVARRSGERLLVSFTDTNDQPRSEVEAALRQSQARERQTHAEADAQRQRLLNIIAEVPALMATMRGPDHVFEVVNTGFQTAFGSRQLVGRSFREVAPELASQGIFDLLDQVYRTGQTYYATEELVYLNEGGELRPGYYNFIYQATYDAAGQRDGILNFAYEVTEQVLARQQLEAQQQQLRQLNEELETRVQQRTQELEASHQAAEALQAELLAAAQRQVQEREHLYQLFAQAQVIVLLLRGPGHRVDYVNAACVQLFGSRLAPGRRVIESMPEAEQQGFVALLDHVYQTGETFRGDEVPFTVHNDDGEPSQTRYFNVTYQAYREHGQIVGLLNFSFDVTEQVLARQQREEQQQLRLLNEELEARVQQRTQELEASHQAAEALQAELLAAAQRQVQEREDIYQVFAQTPAIVLLLRAPNHRIEYVNPACVHLFRGRLLQGRTIVESMPEMEAQGFVALLDQVYQTGETFVGNELPFTVHAADGQPSHTAYFNFSYQAYREQGEIVGISIFAYDVTEQVLARQQQEAQQRLLETVFVQAPVAIFVLRGPQYHVELVNPLMAQMLGRPSPELLGHPYFEVMPELTTGRYPALMQQVWDTGEAVEEQELPAQLSYHRPGETGYFTFVYQPLRDAPDGPVTAIACVTIDVTEQVRARQQVQQLNEELAAINEELTATNEELHESNSQLLRTNADLDNFVYTASHDLKSPITNIEGLLALLPGLLPAAVLADEHVAPVLDRMQESIERFQRTLTHLTDVSRLQAEFAQPTEPVSLAAVIEDVRQDLHFQFLATGAVLEVAVQDTQPRVFSPKNLRSLIYNLLSNALKYRHPERPPRVRISCQPAGNSLVLTVQDNGLGVSAQQQQRLFQLFQRLHTHVEGSGVGLYAVKKIVENAGGTIAVASQEDVGTTFTLTFPA